MNYHLKLKTMDIIINLLFLHILLELKIMNIAEVDNCFVMISSYS